MKRTSILCQQHCGRMFRDKWRVQGKRVITETGAIKALRINNIPFEDANEFVRPMPKLKYPPVINNAGCLPKPVTMDENHPDYHEEPCLKYSDHNVLLGGLEQAKVFTNTYEMDLDTLPILEKLNESSDNSLHNELVQDCIKASLLYEATQEKLPKRKDPERPAYNFPRDYGIPAERKNYLLGRRLVQLCTSMCPQLLGQRRIVPGAVPFQVSMLRDGRKILLNSTADLLITSSAGIQPIVDSAALHSLPLPDIHPMTPFISLESHNIYKFEDFFPINKGLEKSEVHTAIFHYDKHYVTNLFDVDVKESQILARSLMKCFTLAVAQARQRFGDEVVDLPEPITVQAIQTDSEKFHFSILQLNSTAGPDETNLRNAFWNLPIVSLYDLCDYKDGVPVLNEYNPLVFHSLLTFLQNC